MQPTAIFFLFKMHYCTRPFLFSKIPSYLSLWFPPSESLKQVNKQCNVFSNHHKDSKDKHYLKKTYNERCLNKRDNQVSTWNNIIPSLWSMDMDKEHRYDTDIVDIANLIKAGYKNMGTRRHKYVRTYACDIYKNS